jgi:hypothetical protein
MTVPAATRTALLDLHRALLDAERRDYEKVHGRVSGPDFLQVLIQDPAFDWLQPLTRLIAQLDDDELEDACSVLAALRALLSLDPEGSEFQRRYAQRVDQEPDVAVAHGIARAELGRTLNPKANVGVQANRH